MNKAEPRVLNSNALASMDESTELMAAGYSAGSV
jgi:hypothetical protein